MDLSGLDVEIRTLRSSAMDNLTVVEVQVFEQLTPSVRNIVKNLQLTFDGMYVSSKDPALLASIHDTLEAL